MNPASEPTTGSWYWKKATKTLEFVSYNTSAQLKAKRKKPKPIHFKVAKSKGIRSSTVGKPISTSGRSSPKLSSSSRSTRSLDHTSSSKELHKRTQGLVTLDDVKNVAIGLLDVGQRQRMISFSAVVQTQLLDDFLMALLVYLSRYLDRILMIKQPKTLVANTRLVELKALKDVLSAEKCFAHLYCRLILGVGIPEQHQTACKRGNASAELKDWENFESFFRFCTCVAWITFWQKNLPLIQEEVGRLFHSEAFNPARRQKEDSEDNQTKGSFGKKKKAPVPKRIPIYKRPPINNLISQRSPALTALFPLPKDKTGYLFQKHSLHPRIAYRTDENCNWIDMPPAVFPPTVGIIGEPRKEFDPDTLALLTDEIAKKKGTVHFDSHGLEPVCHTDDLDKHSSTLTFGSNGSKTSNKEAKG